MEGDALVRAAVNALEDIKARDIVVLDVRKLTSLFDTVIVASGDSARQTKALIDPLEQQYTAIADDVAAIKSGLDHTPSNPSKFDGPIGTLWHRQSSVSIGGEIPM